MKTRNLVVGALLLFVGLPVLLSATAAAWYYASFYYTPRANGTLVSSGRQREYILYVPASLDRTRPAPLVISLHGAMMWPAAQMETSRWNRVADEHGFIVVYPSGTTLTRNGTGVLPKVWLMGPDSALADDVRFIAELMDTLAARYDVDPARIYVTGFSNGGGMSFALSCTLSDRVAAVGTVAAAQVLPWTWCTDTRPVPMITFHGTADPLVPMGGAPPSLLNPRPFPSVTAWTEGWARRNRCAGDPVTTGVAVGVSRLEYAGCADSAAVVLYTFEGGGHAWPGGKPLPRWLTGPTPGGVDASRLMWEFFVAHPMPGSTSRSP